MAVLIVDQEDRVIGIEDYRTAKESGHILRSSHVFLFSNNSLDELLLTKRPSFERAQASTESLPSGLHVGAGKWQSSACGYVDALDLGDSDYLSIVNDHPEFAEKS